MITLVMWLRLLSVSFALASLPLLAGCPPQDPSGNGADAGGKLVLRTMNFTSPESRRALFRFDIYTITERLGLGETERLDLWRFLDEGAIPASDRRHLAANGLRLGIGGTLTLDRMRALIAERGNVQIQRTPPVFAYHGYALDIPFGVKQADMALLLSRRDGTLAGRDLRVATTWLRFQCLSDDDAKTINVHLTPWIVYGEKQPIYQRTPTGQSLVKKRPRYWVRSLRQVLALRQGQLLAIGLSPGRNLSLGQHLLSRREEPYDLVTTLMFVPTMVTPGAVPVDTPVIGPSGAPEGAAGGN